MPEREGLDAVTQPYDFSCVVGEEAKGGTKMPIRRYVKNGVTFTPQALASMSRALEATTEILGISNDEAKRRDVAKFIIRLSQEDGNLDGAALRDRTVAALGGVAYCALSGIPRPSNPHVSTELAEKRWFPHDGEAGAL
jgi:hypothetical protein